MEMVLLCFQAAVDIALAGALIWAIIEYRHRNRQD